ncbi:MAG: VOC family protein [Gemmataceae bacterium]
MPPILRVVEIGIYVDDLEKTEEFYHTILGLPVVARAPERHVFFQVGDGCVLLAFLPDATLPGDTLPSHGARGAGHFALGIPKESLDGWRTHLDQHSIEIEQEVDWPPGGKSLYFRDPSNNSVELITPGVWELPSGW